MFPLNRPSAPLGTANSVLRARARRHSVRDYPGPLSIKSVTEGAVAWKVGRRELLMEHDSLLVLQAGQPYSLDIDSRTPVATLCIFFQPGFVEGIGGSMAASDLETDGYPALPVEGLHLDCGGILARMRALAAAPTAERLRIDQEFVELACGLVLLNREVERRVRLLPARRASTRNELFRRVRRGQEFLHAHPAADLDLASLARAACLSPYHFHRAFTCAFGRTPHQYRNQLRLGRARRLIERTGMTITEIAGAVGFESPPSFTAAFRQWFGAPPAALRRAQ